MAKSKLPSIETLRKFLRYDPSTGKLFWRKRSPDDFNEGKQSKVWSCRKWNTRYAGNEALATINAQGYPCGSFSGLRLNAHRVAWAIHYGRWPKNEIDHINGIPDDNRIENLRDVTRSVNMRNRRMCSRNTSGYNGVLWCKAKKKWTATGQWNGNYEYIGRFDRLEDALAARRDFEKDKGFTERHGRQE